MMIDEANIGGATIQRRFSMGERYLLAGETLTGDQVRAIPISNRRALIDSNYLSIWPMAPAAIDGADGEKAHGELHVVHVGKGKYDVIVGSKLNTEPLTKDEAMLLASSRMDVPMAAAKGTDEDTGAQGELAH